ncbi:6-carboxytetrahydropterin synthase [Leptolyngbya sp. 15MV]|nr:6-carboxytetrahydropterin synthase [Leptolyngbya sp. 15MV]
MYEIDVQAEFSAAHAIRIAGIVEPLHGHNWHVTATVVGPELDADGLLCDFHTIEQRPTSCRASSPPATMPTPPCAPAPPSALW